MTIPGFTPLLPVSVSDFLKGALIVAVVAGAATYRSASAPQSVRLEITTESGDVYVAGEGDTCAEAWQGAVIPADWTRIICR